MEEKKLINLEIFPQDTTIKEGDFNIKITKLCFFVPMDLFNYLCDDISIKDVSDFIAHLTYKANKVSLKFKWHLADVKTARSKLFKQLKEYGYNI